MTDASEVRQQEYSTYIGGIKGSTARKLAVLADGSAVVATSTQQWPVEGGAIGLGGGGADLGIGVFLPDTIPAYGTGTPGSGGWIPWLSGGGVPAPGNSVRLSVHRGLFGSQGVLIAGGAAAQTQLFGGTLWVGNLWATIPLVMGDVADPWGGPVWHRWILRSRRTRP